jgi:hypothetical protein
MCQHQPQCPSAPAPDRMAAGVAVSHPEQGWSLLCNGIVLFDDAGALLPGGPVLIPPATVRPAKAALSAAAWPGKPASRSISSDGGWSRVASRTQELSLDEVERRRAGEARLAGRVQHARVVHALTWVLHYSLAGLVPSSALAPALSRGEFRIPRRTGGYPSGRTIPAARVIPAASASQLKGAAGSGTKVSFRM